MFMVKSVHGQYKMMKFNSGFTIWINTSFDGRVFTNGTFEISTFEMGLHVTFKFEFAIWKCLDNGNYKFNYRL